MKKLVKDVGVDAGMILICDLDYYKKYEEEPFIDNKISKAFIIKNGTYKTHELYYCEKCGRVFQIVYSPTQKTNLDYLPSWFPKYQHRRVCPNCKDGKDD